MTTTTTSAVSSSTNRASPQGILQGGNPSKYDSSNPITLFVIQAGIIIIFCRLLHYPLSKLRQPRVIAEVIGGILLGPSVMGRIPGFKAAIFPDASIPNLNLVATLGLVLFLFLVGLETDFRFLASNWKIALSVSAAGMILPFGLGCAISYGLYNEFRTEPGLTPINFGTYLLFIGIAMAITAFPVLCRILSELKLLSTNVGVIVLSAGVGNDVVGWILLALCVALVNAGSGLTALWVLLVCVGYVLFLAYAVRPVFMWYLERTGSIQKGPSQSVVAVTLLMALISAFFTQAIGIHAIFGGFVVGLICPHEGGFAIKLTEKVEDLVATIFLPLYFALSGLNTNLGLLDSGIVWGYVIGVIAIAFFAKVIGGALAARFSGLLWRESFTVGVLMSCKGLVELIVLNIGLQAKILSTRTFTIFVVMALVTTFATTPLTSCLYPKWYQVKVERWRRGETDWEGNPLHAEDEDDSTSIVKAKAFSVQKLVVYLRLDTLPNVCTFISLLGPSRDSKTPPATVHYSKTPSVSKTASAAEESLDTAHAEKEWPLQVHGVRLLELTDRDSSVMKVSEADQYSVSDPIINTFRAFGQLNNISMLGGVAVVPEHSYADTVIDMTREVSADFLLIPWSETGAMSDYQNSLSYDGPPRFSSGPYSSFVRRVLEGVSSNVGIFIDHGLSPNRQRPSASQRTVSAMSSGSFRKMMQVQNGIHRHHIFFPFFGGEDDRFALRFVLQLAQNDTVTATIVHVDVPAVPAASATEITEAGSSTSSSSPPHHDKQSDKTFFGAIRDSLPTELSSRVVFKTPITTDKGDSSLSATIDLAREETGRSVGYTGDLIVVGRRINGFGQFWSPEIASVNEVGSETGAVLGAMGEALVMSQNDIRASILILQAGRTTDSPETQNRRG